MPYNNPVIVFYCYSKQVAICIFVFKSHAIVRVTCIFHRCNVFAAITDIIDPQAALVVHDGDISRVVIFKMIIRGGEAANIYVFEI